jgi:hypothetical protein
MICRTTMRGQVKHKHPPSPPWNATATPTLRHPGPRAGVQPANVREPKGTSHPWQRSLPREGLRVTGSRLKAGMTEGWEGAA